MPKACRLGVTLLMGLFGLAAPANADDQTEVGAGNEEAAQLAGGSPLVRSAERFINRQAEQIRDPALRHETVDAITNRQTCVRHRAGITTEEKDRLVRQLLDEHLVRESDGDLIPGGLRAGIFLRSSRMARTALGCLSLSSRRLAAATAAITRSPVAWWCMRHSTISAAFSWRPVIGGFTARVAATAYQSSEGERDTTSRSAAMSRSLLPSGMTGRKPSSSNGTPTEASSSSCPSEAPATTMITGVLATRGPEDITSSGLRRR